MDPSSLIPLPHRAVLRLGGADAASFLQGLITANVRHTTAERAAYSAMLTPQGKMIAEFFLWVDGDAFLIEADTGRMPELLAKLRGYKLRAKVTFADESERWQVAASLTPQQAGLTTPDPRHAGMGTRHLLPAGTAASGQFASYELARIAHFLPGLEDYTERSFALELGLDQFGAVDFAKGCYVGQEVTNRSKHRGVLRKCLAQVHALDGRELPALGTPVLAGDKEIGELRGHWGEHGLALLRIEEFQSTPHPLTAGASALSATLPPWAMQDAA